MSAAATTDDITKRAVTMDVEECRPPALADVAASEHHHTMLLRSVLCAVATGILLALVCDAALPRRAWRANDDDDFPSSSSSVKSCTRPTSGAASVERIRAAAAPSTASPSSSTSRPRRIDDADGTHAGREGQRRRDTSDTNLWRCRDAPRRCGVMYQAFVLDDDTLRRRVESFSARGIGGSGGGGGPAAMGAELWRAVMSAATLRRAHEFAGAPQVGEVLLVTNYPAAMIGAARVAYERVRATLGACLRAPNGSRSALLDVTLVLANATTTTMATDTEISDAEPLGSDPFLAAVGCPPWPFDRVATARAGFKYAVKADALDVSRHEFVGSSSSSSDGAASVDRTLFIDSDTVVRLPVFPMFDCLRYFDVGMTQESNWHRGVSPYLYTPVLLSFLPPRWSAQSSAASGLWWTPHHDVRAKPRKKAPTAFGINAALYEVQYNTGLIAFRTPRAAGDSAGTRDFFRTWSALHRGSSRCANDRVLWDQCSLPEAIRASTQVRVCTLSDTFDFREALGYGCSARAYVATAAAAASDATAAAARDVPGDAWAGRERDGMFPAAGVRLLHLHEVKQRQVEWLARSALWRRLRSS